MEPQNTNALDIVQDLIAIHTTRKEIVDKLSAKAGSNAAAAKWQSARKQSDQFITKLLNELSGFGDAVKDSSDRDNEYQLTWKDTLGKLDGLQEEEAPGLFNRQEQILKQYYQELLQINNLPASLTQLLSAQSSNLE